MSRTLLSWLMLASVLLWTGCDQTTDPQDNTAPPNNQPPLTSVDTQQSKDDPALEPGRYIVVFADQGDRKINEEAAQQAVQRTDAIFSDLGIQQDSLIHQYKYALKGFAARLTKAQVEQLRSDSRVEQVVQDVKYKAIQMMPSPSAPAPAPRRAQTTPWGVTRVGGPLNGSGKTAWVLDTGIDLNHSDLNVDVSSSVSFVAGESADDGYGHGSHVAGIIAAKDNSIDVVGVAAGADVVSVKVCNSSGQCYTSDVDAGIDYVASNYSSGDVANISLSWPTNDPNWPTIDLALSVLESTIDAAADDGLLFTLSAGNQGQDASNRSPARVNHSNVFTLSAFDASDNFAWFSNYGNPPVDFGTPGVGILSLWRNGGTYTANGTSMAAPHFAGLLLTVPNDIITDGDVNNDPDTHSDPIAAHLPPPTITGSVPNDRPELDWSAIPNAQSYKVYRSFEGGSWTEEANTPATYFNDNEVVDPDLQKLTGPPGNDEDYWTYKVHTISTAGTKSDASNYLYFGIVESCHPPVCP